MKMLKCIPLVQVYVLWRGKTQGEQGQSKMRNLHSKSNNLTIHTFDFLVENWHLSKGSDVSDCSLSSQKTFASESCVTCLQRFVETETAACPFLAQLPHQTFVQIKVGH